LEVETMKTGSELKALSFTLAATAITLWTLSGATRRAGIIITSVALAIYAIGLAIEGKQK
jgi:hypothetical protein